MPKGFFMCNNWNYTKRDGVMNLEQKRIGFNKKEIICKKQN